MEITLRRHNHPASVKDYGRMTIETLALLSLIGQGMDLLQKATHFSLRFLFKTQLYKSKGTDYSDKFARNHRLQESRNRKQP